MDRSDYHLIQYIQEKENIKRKDKVLEEQKMMEPPIDEHVVLMEELE